MLGPPVIYRLVWSVTDAGLRSDIFDFAYRHIDGATILAVVVILGGAYALFNLAFHIIRFRAE